MAQLPTHVMRCSTHFAPLTANHRKNGHGSLRKQRVEKKREGGEDLSRQDVSPKQGRCKHPKKRKPRGGRKKKAKKKKKKKRETQEAGFTNHNCPIIPSFYPFLIQFKDPQKKKRKKRDPEKKKKKKEMARIRKVIKIIPSLSPTRLQYLLRECAAENKRREGRKRGCRRAGKGKQ